MVNVSVLPTVVLMLH